MRLTKAQQTDVDLCRYFHPCNPTEEEVDQYLALSERGEGKERGKFSENPLIIGKTRRGLMMRLYEEGVLEGSVPYSVLLEGAPEYVVEFMKKEMFRGIDAEIIEECRRMLCTTP